MEKRTAKVGSKALQFGLRTDDSPQKIVGNQHQGQPEAHHWALFGSISVFSILLICWVLGITQLRTIMIGSQKVSTNISESQLADKIDREAQRVSISIASNKGEKKDFSLAQMGVSVDAKASAQATKSSVRNFRKTLLWWNTVPVQLNTKTNGNTLDTFITTNARIDIEPVKNALLTINPDGTVATSKEESGKILTVPGGKQAIIDSVNQLKNTSFTLVERDVRPSITMSAADAGKAKVEEILSKKISLNLDGKVITPDAHDIANWLIVTPNETDKRYDISTDSGKVGDYINKIAAANVRRPRDQVEVTHSDGGKVILVKGVDGLDISNKDAVVKQIVNDLLNQKEIASTLEVKKTPFKVSSTTGGDKLLEVDITNKRMYAYENNVLVRTFLVSAGAPATPTVTGTFSIYSKVRIQDMRGSNADGSKYLQPDVEWVNYFYRDYAVHGNYWRPTSYFGNVNSSHGCVGIVNSDAEWVYNWAPIGTSVIVHT